MSVFWSQITPRVKTAHKRLVRPSGCSAPEDLRFTSRAKAKPSSPSYGRSAAERLRRLEAKPRAQSLLLEDDGASAPYRWSIRKKIEQ